MKNRFFWLSSLLFFSCLTFFACKSLSSIQANIDNQEITLFEVEAQFDNPFHELVDSNLVSTQVGNKIMLLVDDANSIYVEDRILDEEGKYMFNSSLTVDTNLKKENNVWIYEIPYNTARRFSSNYGDVVGGNKELRGIMFTINCNENIKYYPLVINIIQE